MDWQTAVEVLQAAALAPGLGLVTDVDGTISPIVDVPEQARVSERAARALALLSQRLPVVAVISGRAAKDVAERVGLPGLVYLGNHGLERWVEGQARVMPSAAAYREALEAAGREIEAILEAGMQPEDKGATLSFHYRRARDPGVAERLRPHFLAIAADHGLRLTEGRMVFELRPPVEIDKGSAFEALVREHDLEAALYLGDDTTDVAAFESASRSRSAGECLAYSLGVISPGTPRQVAEAADYHVQGVAGVESFLEWLLKARLASST